MDQSYREADEPATKRSKIPNDNENPSPIPTVNLSSSHNTPLSIEGLLSIPLVVIFRQVSSSNRFKPLLTRTEAQSMIRINMLAQQGDVLIQLAFDTLAKKRWCKCIEPIVVSHPILRSLVPLLHCHGMTDKALMYIQQEISKVLQELTSLSTLMQQFAEQNYTLAESLLDALGGNSLAEEKKLLGDLEEEIFGRCNELLQMTECQSTGSAVNPLSMKNFCESLFGETTTAETQRYGMHTIVENSQQRKQLPEEATDKGDQAGECCTNREFGSDGNVVVLNTMANRKIFKPNEIKTIGESELPGAASEGLNPTVATATGPKHNADDVDEQSQPGGEDTHPSALHVMQINATMEIGSTEQQHELEGGDAPRNELIYNEDIDAELSPKKFHQPKPNYADAKKKEYTRSSSQEIRMSAALALIQGAKQSSIKPANADEPTKPPKFNNTTERTSFQQRGTHSKARKIDILFQNQSPLNAETSIVIHQDLRHQASLSTKQIPPLIEHYSNVANTQSAIHALQRLSNSDLH